jgi:hypothetical protein
MTSKILNEKGNTLHRSSFRPLTQEEENNIDEKEKRKAFDRKVAEYLGPDMKMEEASDEDTPEYKSYEDDSSNYERTDKKDEADQEAIDPYLQAEVLLPIAGEMLTGRVSKRKRDADGNLIGKSATNPIMDKRMYVMTFLDKREAEYSANVIAENMLSMCDVEGNQFVIMKHILDHRKEETAVSKEDAFTWSRRQKNVRVAFKILEDDSETPPGYQFMKCHLIFDVKFDGFKFKSRMVAGGHKVETVGLERKRNF